MLCLVTWSCPAVCDPTDCSPPGSPVHWGFSRQEYWSGLPSPPPGDLPNPGIKPRSPTLQVYSLLSETPGKPKRSGWPLPFSRGSSQPRNQTGVSCIAGRFFASWATRESLCVCVCICIYIYVCVYIHIYIYNILFIHSSLKRYLYYFYVLGIYCQ